LQRALLTAALSGVGTGACAQEQAARLEFDVASVKQNRSDAATTNSNFLLSTGDVYVANGGSLVANNYKFLGLLPSGRHFDSSQPLGKLPLLRKIVVKPPNSGNRANIHQTKKIKLQAKYI